MTKGNPALHYTNTLSPVLLVRYNLIQGRMENRDTLAFLLLNEVRRLTTKNTVNQTEPPKLIKQFRFPRRYFNRLHAESTLKPRLKIWPTVKAISKFIKIKARHSNITLRLESEIIKTALLFLLSVKRHWTANWQCTVTKSNLRNPFPFPCPFRE